ncbi:MAG TPA: ABC transporter permease, partial [Puia sp.]|nr:ABC transporter permease [Puia sp.]
MLKNYFRISLRNLRRNKGYAVFNILGLSMGIAICLLIFLVISFESGFDNFHKNKSRIYRILTEYHHADSKEIFYGRAVPFAFPPVIRSLKDVQESAPIFSDNDVQMVVPGAENNGSKKFKEEKGVFFTTPNFFKIFDFPLISGSYESLAGPNNALVTKSIAEKYFGNWKDAIGKTIRINNSFTIKVNGVLADVPVNTGFPFKVVIAYGTAFTNRFLHSTDFDGTSSANGCYVLLSPGASESAFNKELIAYSKKMKSPENKDV